MTDMIGIKNISVFLPGQEDTFFTGVVRMKLYTVSTGDTAYRYEKSIVVFFKGARKVLSTSVFNGGYHENYKAVFNHDGKVGSGMPCEMLADTYAEHMRRLAKRIGLEPELVTGMGTAADMENVAIESLNYKELTVTAIVTGGIETNGGRVGDPADYYKPAEKPDKLGTINIILILDADMPPGTLARALVTCTEAKTAAIQELLAGSNYSTGLATGSGTDQTIIVANSDSALYFEGAGKHSKMGELIGKTVTKAVKAALSKQSGLNPKTQHNVFRRLKRFQVTTQSIWLLFQQQLAVLKPDFLEAAEKLAQEPVMLTYTSLYIHLLDQFLWGLLDKDEVMNAAEDYSELKLRRALKNSKVLSSDVSAAFDPNYPSVMTKRNAAYFGRGLVFNKYTGARGKSGSNDANAEYVGYLRNIMDNNNVSFQTAELGKVDQGGGGTIAYILANYGMSVIDSGVAVLNMHAPWELISKVDLYEAYNGYVAFLKEA